MTDLQHKYLENLATDEVHRVVFRSVGGKRKRLSQEECQIDDIKHKAWLTEAEAEAKPAENRCGHCWPAVGGIMSGPQTAIVDAGEKVEPVE